MPYTFRDRATTKRFDADAADDADFSDPESPMPVKRGRGRPRKHAAPLASRTSVNAGAAADSDDEGSLDGVEQIVRGPGVPPSLDASRMWPPEEDEALKEAIAQYDHKWKLITKFMHKRGFKRTAAMCRNRNARMNIIRKPGKEGKNRCKRCGQVKRGHTCGVPPPEVQRVCRVVGDGSSALAIARAGEAAAAAFETGAATSFGDSLPAHSLLPSGTGFQVDIDGLFAHLSDQNQRAPPTRHDTTPVMTPRSDEAPPPAHAVGFLGSAAPPSVAPAAARPSLYDSSSASSSFFSASIDLAELQHLSAQALNSKSFDLLLGGGGSAAHPHQQGEAPPTGHSGAPPPPSAAASPTPDGANRHHGDALAARRTECNETPTAVGSVAGGDDRESEHDAALELVAELEETAATPSHDASPPALGAAMRAAHLSHPHHQPVPRSLPPNIAPVPPLASNPSLALDKLLPAIAPPNLGAHKSFGAALDGALSMRPPLERFLQPSYLPNPASRAGSPILTELTTMADTVPPALMAIPSISHAPSFTFADMLPSSQQSFSFTDLESSQGTQAAAAVFSTPTPMCV